MCFHHLKPNSSHSLLHVIKAVNLPRELYRSPLSKSSVNHHSMLGKKSKGFVNRGGEKKAVSRSDNSESS